MARLSLSTNGFPQSEFLFALEWAGEIGLNSVEVDLNTARRLSTDGEYVEKVLKQAEKTGTCFSSMHSWNTADDLEEVCTTAHKIGAGLIVVHTPHQMLEEQFEQIKDSLHHWIEWCASNSIILTVENAGTQPLHPFVDLFHALPDLTCTLDVKHAYKPKRLGLNHKDYMKEIGDRVRNLHLCGIDRSRGHLGDGCPPGNDHVDWKELSADLKALNYTGLLTIEVCFPEWLSEEELRDNYDYIPQESPKEKSVSCRVSRFCAQYFREQFGSILGQ